MRGCLLTRDEGLLLFALLAGLAERALCSSDPGPRINTLFA